MKHPDIDRLKVKRKICNVQTLNLKKSWIVSINIKQSRLKNKKITKRHHYVIRGQFTKKTYNLLYVCAHRKAKTKTKNGIKIQLEELQGEINKPTIIFGGL